MVLDGIHILVVRFASVCLSLTSPVLLSFWLFDDDAWADLASSIELVLTWKRGCCKHETPETGHCKSR